MTPLGPLGAMSRTAGHGESPRDGSVEQAAREFESVFVRQLLETAHVGEASGEYSNLSVDAIAKAIEDGGGLGLASAITRAVGTDEHAAAKAG